MYYPYLRGRQFELIALREFAKQKGENNNVVPVIEPVKKAFNSMKLALPIFMENDLRFSLVLNPRVGEINRLTKGNTGDMVEYILEQLKGVLNNDAWIPTYIVTDNYLEINEIIEKREQTNVMLILSDNTNVSDDNFIRLVENDRVTSILTKENRSLRRNLGRRINRDDLALIRLDDNFHALKRNKDYLPMPEEKFTDEHLFYAEDNYSGFSDYTVLNSDFVEGGMTPYAVAIHLTYKKDNEEVWMRHFTSESNEGMENIQGKFAEAARKAVAFADDYDLNTLAVNELRKYFHEGRYPGLGMVKKISIKNHLELINGLS